MGPHASSQVGSVARVHGHVWRRRVISGARARQGFAEFARRVLLWGRQPACHAFLCVPAWSRASPEASPRPPRGLPEASPRSPRGLGTRRDASTGSMPHMNSAKPSRSSVRSVEHRGRDVGETLEREALTGAPGVHSLESHARYATRGSDVDGTPEREALTRGRGADAKCDRALISYIRMYGNYRTFVCVVICLFPLPASRLHL